MESFLARFGSLVTAVLSGFDRLVFRGTLIPLVMPGGMHTFLTRAKVRLLDFKEYVLQTSNNVKAASLREAIAADRPIRYLTSSKTDKEDFSHRLLDEHPIDEGLVCAFKVLEPCMSFEYHRSQDKAERGLKPMPLSSDASTGIPSWAWLEGTTRTDASWTPLVAITHETRQESIEVTGSDVRIVA